MSTIKSINLAILSGFLLAFSWFPFGFTPLIFIALVPLLMVEKSFVDDREKNSLLLILCSYTTFFLWNIIVTWWIKNASFGGAVMAIVCNALLMTTAFMLAHYAKKRIGSLWGSLIFISFWMSFEYLHLNWELTYPWLTMGNVFAGALDWIQWYEYTGVFGGTIWIWVVNIMVLRLITGRIGENEGFNKRLLIAVPLAIIVPIVVSFIIKNGVDIEGSEKLNVVVVQPNVDPYNEKFNRSPKDQLKEMLDLASQKVDSTTDYVLFPETALIEYCWENKLKHTMSFSLLNEYLENYPKLNVIIGASTLKRYEEGEVLSETVRKFSDADIYYDSYNTALNLSKDSSVQFYHKSKLVPGVERMPFPHILKYIEGLAIDLGGTTGSLGSQEERSVFVSQYDSTRTAPVICYESIYGEFVGGFARNGADFISLITNDGWWGDTPGYKQHLKYGVLRAIETRLWIARSANTGISCFVNPRGEIIKETEYWKPAVIAHSISKGKRFTFYTVYGDYLAHIALFFSTLLFTYSLSIRFKLVKK